MDFDPAKMSVTLGYINGAIEVLNIENISEEGNIFFIMTPQLRIMQKDAILCLSIIPDPLHSYIGFVSETSFSGLNYDKKSNPFAKIKIVRG